MNDGERRESRRYRGENRAERRASRRRRLLDIGLQAFGTGEYGSSTIERLCADAGVTIRSFYEEFDGREALLAAVYDETALLVQEAVFPVLAEPGVDMANRVDRTVEAFIHAALDDPRRGRVLCLTSMAVSDAMEQRRRVVLHAFASAVDQQTDALIQGGMPIYLHQSHLVVCGLIGASSALVVEYLTSTDPPSLDAITQAMKEMWLAVIAQAIPEAVPPLTATAKMVHAGSGS